MSFKYVTIDSQDIFHKLDVTVCGKKGEKSPTASYLSIQAINFALLTKEYLRFGRVLVIEEKFYRE